MVSFIIKVSFYGIEYYFHIRKQIVIDFFIERN